MYCSGEPPSCGPFLYVRSLHLGNGVYRYLGAEVLSRLPSLPPCVAPVCVGQKMDDMLAFADRAGFVLPADSCLVGVYYFDGLVRHTYCWPVGVASGGE